MIKHTNDIANKNKLNIETTEIVIIPIIRVTTKKIISTNKLISEQGFLFILNFYFLV